MEVQAAPRSRIHPVVATAAVAVTIASAVAVAVMTGVLPQGTAKPAEPAVVAQVAPAPAPVVAAPAPVAPQPVVVAAPEPAPEARPEPKPVAKPKPKPAVHHSASVHEQPVQVAQSAPVPPPSAGVPPDYRPAADTPPPPPPAPVAKAMCLDCGVVVSMREIEQKGEGTGLGAVAGGVLGGLLGHQVGGGHGKTAATVVGAAAGAYGGHQVEKNVRSTKRFEIGLRMEDGSTRTIVQDTAPTWRAGDRVRVVNGTLQANPG